MTLQDSKKFYSRFLNGHHGVLHFAAHSHHFWPDVTREAQIEYWDDCAKNSDEKWNKIFTDVIPRAQRHIAQILNLKDPNQIVFAPNTHELSVRLLSLFIGRSKLSILTTQNEFHSWKRQIMRLMELPEVQVTMVESKVKSELLGKLKVELLKKPDVFYLSQVFFDSGVALTDDELLELKASCPSETMMIIDGYHAFAALPTDLSALEGHIFYLAGGYKYAQAGEGVGFMVVPKGSWRPVNTGWFAEYGELTKPRGTQVGYSENAMAFMGATQDPSGLYRFNSVWDLFQNSGFSVPAIHRYVKELQETFIKNVPAGLISGQGLTPLFDPKLSWHGHFLTYEAKNEISAQSTQEGLKKLNILIDRRGKRLRFGMGLYHDKSDVLELCERLKKMAT